VTSRVSVRASAKYAALFSLAFWACSEGTATAPPTGNAGTGAGGGSGTAALLAGQGGEPNGEFAGQAGQRVSDGGAAAGATGGEAGAHQHPLPRGGSAGTGGATGGAGEAGAGAGGEAGAYTPPPCTVEAPTTCPDPAPTYADVEPIFRQRCVICHMGSANGPWPLTNYGHMSSWRDEIRAMLLTCSMPPPEERTPLPNAENELILQWIRCGMPP
jgi:hypothetical protein